MDTPFQNYIYAKYHILAKLLLLVLENNAGNHLRGEWQTAYTEVIEKYSLHLIQLTAFSQIPNGTGKHLFYFRPILRNESFCCFPTTQRHGKISHTPLFYCSEFEKSQARCLYDLQVTSHNLGNHLKASNIVKFYEEHYKKQQN